MPTNPRTVFLLAPTFPEKPSIYPCVINSRFHRQVAVKSPPRVFRSYLSHQGPVFVFDIRGELWAITAHYRAKKLGRQVVAIDPFGVTRGKNFQEGKPEALLKPYTFNPFDSIPEDQQQRDRMMNAFAASFVINEGGFSSHFDENAKILIRGYMDYLMTKIAPNQRKLPLLLSSRQTILNKRNAPLPKVTLI